MSLLETDYRRHCSSLSVTTVVHELALEIHGTMTSVVYIYKIAKASSFWNTLYCTASGNSEVGERRGKESVYITRPHPIHLPVNIITRRVKGRFVRTLSCATLLLSPPRSSPAIKKKRADPSRFFSFNARPPSLRILARSLLPSSVSANSLDHLG